MEQDKEISHMDTEPLDSAEPSQSIPPNPEPKKQETNPPPAQPAPILSRSKIACTECRKAKQRCITDGSLATCKRCQLYNFVCEYTPHDTTRPRPTTGSIGNEPYPSRTASTGKTPRRGNSATSRPQTQQTMEHLGSVDDSLRAIVDRLNKIDLTLRDGVTVKQASGSSYSYRHETNQEMRIPSPRTSSTPDSGSAGGFEARGHDFAPNWSSGGSSSLSNGIDFTDPLQAFRVSIANLQALTNEAATNMPLNTTKATMDADETFNCEFPHLDAIHRGILSAQDASALFDFFFAHCHPWVPFLDETDKDTLAVRQRSTLLFHVICMTATYFSCSANPRSLAVYTSLVRLVDESMGHLLLTAKTGDFSIETVKALMVTVAWRPVQSNPGVPLTGHSHMYSKLNDGASYLTIGMIMYIVHRMGLQHTTDQLPAVDHRLEPGGGVDQEMQATVARCRTLYGSIIIDTQASLQADRAPNSLDVEGALKSVRLFSTVGLAPSDAWFAAMTELFALGRRANIMYQNHPTDAMVDYPFIQECNTDLDRWHQTWNFLLAKSRGSFFERYVRICFDLVFPYMRFRINSFGRLQSARDSNGPIHLNPHLRKMLNTAVRSAEEIVMKLCTESLEADGTRALKWPQPYARDPSKYPPLTPDGDLAAMISTSPDCYLSILVGFPPLWLGKLLSEGMVDTDLNLLPDGSMPSELGPENVSHTKICRIFQLMGKFLPMAAPHPNHFAVLEGQVFTNLRALLSQFAGSWRPRQGEDLLNRFLSGDLSVDWGRLEDVAALVKWPPPSNLPPGPSA